MVRRREGTGKEGRGGVKDEGGGAKENWSCKEEREQIAIRTGKGGCEKRKKGGNGEG